MSSWWKMAAMRWIAVAMVTGVVPACSPQDDVPPNKASQQPPAGPHGSHSALGAFLAGRLAQEDGATDHAADFYAAALARDPDNAELLQRTFTLMLAEGRFKAAVPMARRLQELDADSAMPALVSGLADVQAGHVAEAQSRFVAMPQRGLNGIVGPLMAAWTAAAQGQFDGALAALAPLDQTKGFAGIKIYHSALINDLAGRTETAETLYLQTLEGQLSIRGIEATGSLYQRLGRMEQAKALYQRYHDEHPDTLLFDGATLAQADTAIARTVPDASAGMAEALFDVATLMRQGNGQEAAIIFTRLALYMRPDFPLARAVLADMLSSEERLKTANALYDSIPTSAPAYYYGQLRQAVNLEELGDTDGALTKLARLSKAKPNNLDPLVTKGDILRRKKRFAEAAEAYGQALALVGDHLSVQHWPLLYSRGICLERTKQWGRAEADFKKALEFKPDQPDVLNYLGYTWVDAGINLEEGKAMLEKAVSLRPRDGAIVDSLGWALYRLGDFQNAVKYLERAIELKAEDPTINDHLGDAYWQVGRTAEAMFQWRRAMTLDPEPEQIEPLREKLRTGQVPVTPKAP